MTMNWDDILDEQAGDAGLPPEGPYTVKVLSAEGKIAGSGNPMVNLKVAIVGGPYAGTEIYTNVVITPNNPKAMKWTLRKLAALGVSREYLREHKPDQNGIAGLINQTLPTVEATIGISEWQDEKRSDIKGFKAIADGATTPPVSNGPSVPMPGSGGVPSVGNIPTPPMPTQSDTPMPGSSPDPF